MILKKEEFDVLVRRMRQAIERYREGKTDTICGCDECVEERGEEEDGRDAGPNEKQILREGIDTKICYGGLNDEFHRRHSS